MDGFFTKQVYESFAITVRFENNLVSGENIATYDVKAYLNDTDVTSEVIGTVSMIANILYINVKDGKSGRKYKLTTKVVTSKDNKFESDITMHVLNI